MTGEWGLSMHLAIFLELLWLDLFPAGTYIPPNSIITLLLTLAVAGHFGLESAGQLAIPVLLALPAALTGAHVEYLHRRWRNQQYTDLLHWGRVAEHPGKGDSPLWRIMVRSLGELFALNLGLFCVWLLVLVGTIELMSNYIGHLPAVPGIAWGHVWFVGAMGGMLALRLRRAYAAFALALLAASAASFI
ncbi:hypothetical protein DA2_0473 [Desulfovibrio sp. A2]|nr:hypothetical protein DA2_0473 [Desulfovibrio sp. A2]